MRAPCHSTTTPTRAARRRRFALARATAPRARRNAQVGLAPSAARMKPALALLALLALPLAGTASAADAPSLGACVNYAYVADYQWHYLCVEPADTSCPIYTRVSNGVAWGPKECLVEPPAVSSDLLAPRCILFAQDLDYSHHACVDTRDASCPVYTLRTSGGHSDKWCPGDL